MSTLSTKKQKFKLDHPFYLVIPYILFIFVAAMGDFRLWRRMSESLGTITKIFSMGAIGLAFLVLFITANFVDLKKIWKFLLFFSLPILAIFLWSIGIWILNFEDLSLMIGGTRKLFFQVINILVLTSGIYMFRYRAIDYTFYGLTLANFAMIILGVKEFGISESYASFVNGAIHGLSNFGFMRTIEINDITFALGLFLLYYVFFDKGGKYRAFKIICCVVLIFFGYKRIALAGLVVATVVFFIMKNLKDSTKRRFMGICGIGTIIVCFLYIWAVKTNLFAEIMASLGIDTMGRDLINNYINQLYEISPDFIGYGFEASIALASKISNGLLAAIHNDIVKAYIEFGFFGFFIWGSFYFYYQPKWYTKHFGEKTSMLFFVLLTYMFLTYLTDNTFFYYWDSMILRLIPFAYIFKPEQELDSYKIKRRKKEIRALRLDKESEYRLRSVIK